MGEPRYVLLDADVSEYFEETKSCFIYGLYFATILMASQTLETLLCSVLRAVGDKVKDKTFKEI
ncbi:MAG: hypothetical protein H3Z51_13245, partial [archaeon]|nr:hypothetical protein [archaeon]